MNKNILVIGGTRFFGQHLVTCLLEKGYEVTVATRGSTPDPFGDSVKRIAFDRSDKQSFSKSFEDGYWDVVYDQICYSSEDAQDAIDVFKGKTNRYVFTSSFAVYDKRETAYQFVEADFNPYKYSIIMDKREAFSYDEGKRQAEAVFFQNAPFPVVAVRIPIVLGENDYTERLKFYVEEIHTGEAIYLSNKNTQMNFISEQEAGDFLAWLSTNDYAGPINACSNNPMALGDLMQLIEETTGSKVIYSDQELESPFSRLYSWTMDTTKAKQLGYTFTNLQDWLPSLITYIYKKM